jgi:hypothetical protein
MDTHGGIVRLILEEQEWDILMARRDTPGYGDHPDQSCHRAFSVLLHLDLIYCCIFHGYTDRGGSYRTLFFCFLWLNPTHMSFTLFISLSLPPETLDTSPTYL